MRHRDYSIIRAAELGETRESRRCVSSYLFLKSQRFTYFYIARKKRIKTSFNTFVHLLKALNSKHIIKTTRRLR